MKISRSLVLVAFITFLTTPAIAAKNAWTQCGIGAMIFPGTGWAAVTSNIIWDFGVSATLSSSTSESQCAGRSANAAKFIHQNYAVLEEETAVGDGAHLVTVLNILDCKQGTHDKIIDSVRAKFSQEMKAGQYGGEMYFNNLMNVIETSYPTQCQTT